MGKIDSNDRDWSDLPKDVLTVIGNRFQSLDDILRFRSVCSSFRFSLSPPPKTLIPDSARQNSLPIGIPTSRNRCLLTESTVYAIEPLNKLSNTHETTQTWLVKIEESDSGKLQFKDPLTGLPFPNFPNVLPKSLNLLKYRVKEVTKAYKLESVTICKGKSRAYVAEMYKSGTAGSFRKVVASACLDAFVVMGIYEGKLFVWRVGDDRLMEIDIAHSDFLDIICHDKKFHALRRTGHVITFDSTSFNVTRVVEPRHNWINWDNYLVNSLNDLLLVYQYSTLPRNQLKYGVCKLDQEKNEWVRVVNELKDMVFFVSHHDCSFSVSAQEFSGCKGNCIYFNDFHLYNFHRNQPGKNARVFNLKNNTFHWLSDLPDYSKIFWPPPTWLQGRAGSAPLPRPRN